MDKLKEEYCIMNGWIKKKGILIDMDAVDDDHDKFFVPEDCKEDYYEECEMWIDKEGDDIGVYDDYDIIEHVEDSGVVDFNKWKTLKEASTSD